MSTTSGETEWEREMIYSMWNSPSCESNDGKRYEFDDIRAVTFPLDYLMDFLRSSPVEDVVTEMILRRMEKQELIFAIYEVLQALLNNKPVPDGGHAGYQEAIIAELLHQTHARVRQELENGEFGSHARKAAWESYQRLCASADAGGSKRYFLLKDIELDPADPRIHESRAITDDIWRDILIGDAGLWDEFLWDDDWRMDSLLDLPESRTALVTAMVGLNLELVHRLPHTPSDAETRMAEHFIRFVIWRGEVADQGGRHAT